MTTIITKNSSTASAVPLAADLVQGELAVNVTDKRVYTKNASAAVIEVGTNPSTITTTTVNGLTVGKGAGSVATNTAVGASALAANTTGAEIVSVGWGALGSNTTGTASTAIGRAAVSSNTTGNYNTGIGHNTLQTNTTGSNNVAIGESALISNTTANNNTAVGYQAGYSGTTFAGVGACTYLGYQAGYNNNEYSMTAVGHNAGLSSTAGRGSTYIGQGAGSDVTTGSKNTVLGRYTGNQGGLDIRTASNYIVLSDGDGNPYAYWNQGAYTSATFKATGNDQWLTLTSSAAAFSTTLFLNAAGGGSGVVKSGARLICYAGNQETNGVYLANGSSTSWASTSDERFKTDLKPIENAANKVATLRSMTGRYITDEEGTSRSFLIAQDVQAVLPEAVDATDPEKLGVQYTEVIPLLVAALKELNTKVDAQAAEIAALKGTA